MIRHNNIKILLFIRLPLVIHWLTILILTSLPSDSLPSFSLGDKIEHLLAFFVLGFFLYFNFLIQDKFYLLRKNPLLMAILFASIYGAFDEIHQMFIPGRFADITDWVADFIGAVLGGLTASFIYYFFKETIRNFLNIKLEPLPEKLVK